MVAQRYRVYVTKMDGREILYGVLTSVPQLKDLPFPAKSIRSEAVETG